MSEEIPKKEVVAGAVREARENTMSGDIEVNGESSEGEIVKFLTEYQNAVIANIDSKISSKTKRVNLLDEEIGKLSDQIGEWEGKAGGDQIVENLRAQIMRHSEEIGQIKGGADVEGEIPSLTKRLEEAVHMKEAIAGNPSLFAKKYASEIEKLKGDFAPMESLAA